MIQIKQGLTDGAAACTTLALWSQRSLDQHLGPGKVLLSGFVSVSEGTADVGFALLPLLVAVVLRSLRYLNNFFLIATSPALRLFLWKSQKNFLSVLRR